jgi:XTP/dITP diphosphohydrolase/tetrapyrrole methylase family protein/MazG family protein
VSEIKRLRDLMARLRAPDGCPWDQEQTHQSIARCLVEEAAEVLEAIDTENTELLREELGDLLLQVVFHAQIEEEAGRFDLEDVAREISEKLIRRHPHVFGDPRDKEEDADAVIDRWEKIKAEERKAKGLDESKTLFKELPPQLPSTLYAHDVYKQAGKLGLIKKGDWKAEEVASSAHNLTEREAGRILFQWVAACRDSGIDPESALRKFASSQVSKFEQQNNHSSI